MAKFRYNATDSRGRWTSGEAEGPTFQEVEARLLAQGLTVESMVEAEEDRGPGSSRSQARELLEQLIGLTRSGLPLPSGLRASALEIESPALRATFEDLARQVESGTSLDDAMIATRHQFPAHLRGLILAGARSGRLADVLGESVENANLTDELRRRFWSIVAYPTVTAVVVLVLVVCICSLAVKAADGVFLGLKDFGVTSNQQLEVLVVLARVVADHWFEGLVAALGLALLSSLTVRFTTNPAVRRRMACNLPVVGPALRYTSLTEYCRLLAMLLESEIPLPEALELAGQSVRDADVAEASHRMARAIDQGEPLSRAFYLWDAIPAGLGQLFRWSEDQQSLPQALRMASEMFEARARSQSDFAANVLSTLLTLLILWGVGFALAVVYLPLTTMIYVIGRLAGSIVLLGG